MSMFQCASAPKLQKGTPSEFEDVYFQRWNAGIEEGGSGINIYIKVKGNSIQLESVYFRGKITKLQTNQNDSLLYVGRFKSKTMDKEETSLDMNFKLKDDECVISYVSETKIRYFKISNLREKEAFNYPSSPLNE